jgi:hypothetical protein
VSTGPVRRDDTARRRDAYVDGSSSSIHKKVVVASFGEAMAVAVLALCICYQ